MRQIIFTLLLSTVFQISAAEEKPAFDKWTDPKVFPGELTMTDKGLDDGKSVIPLGIKLDLVKAAALYEDAGLLVVVTQAAEVRYYDKRKEGWGYASSANQANAILGKAQFTRAPGLLYLTTADRTKMSKFERGKGLLPDFTPQRIIRSSHQKSIHLLGFEDDAKNPTFSNVFWIDPSRMKVFVSTAPRKSMELALPERIGEGIPCNGYPTAVFLIEGKGYLAQTQSGWAQFDVAGKIVKWFKDTRREKWDGVSFSDGVFKLHFYLNPLGRQTYSLKVKSGALEADVNPF